MQKLIDLRKNYQIACDNFSESRNRLYNSITGEDYIEDLHIIIKESYEKARKDYVNYKNELGIKIL